MVNKVTVILVFYINLAVCFGQNIKINKVEPPNWWAGMKWNKVQLMVYGKDLHNISAEFNNKEIKVLKVHNAESSSYSFIDIRIPSDLNPGTYKLIIHKDGIKKEIDFPILRKKSSKNNFQGFSNKDVIYLIMTDRFADGDTSNNIVKGTLDEYNINNPSGRHGGDIQGIIDHLNYIKDLGVTAIWLTPVIENNTRISYHGYAATNMYKVDPRFGSNNLYKKLVTDAHADGLKCILDHVSNHISIDHPWMKDLPFKDWIHGTVKHHQISRNDKLVFADIHRDSSTIINTTEGWFTDDMPDLNQSNPYLSNYLIQNTIWWVESTGVDGIREDTYPYCDQKHMARWGKALLTEFPKLNIVGEVFTGDAVFLSSFQTHTYYPRKFDSNLPAITDFATYDAYTAFLKNSKGLHNIYEDYAKDFIYHNPDNLVTFVDNHDVTRALLQANGNFNKFKMALLMLLTSRGIPALLYGTEIGMKGGRSDGLIRTDFPGGFPGDTLNAFTSEGRTKEQNDIYNYVNKILILRDKHPALSTGKLIEFPPYNKLFVYFKVNGNDKFMVILNNNSEEKTVDLSDYKDQLKSVKEIKNLINGKSSNILNECSIKISGESGTLYELIK